MTSCYRKVFYSLSLSSGLALLSCEAQADLHLNELISMDIEDLMKIKITSSTLTDQSLKTVPSSMTIYTRADIRRLGVRTLPELLNFIPGYQSYRTDYSGTSTSISSRGRAQGAAGAEILILIDGQRLNNDWSGANSQTDSLISLENVERVEFIRGPGSAIYGSNAMTGVINIITQSKREAVVEMGNDRRLHSSLQWHVDNDDSLKAKLNVYASHSQSDGESLTIFQSATTEVDSHDPYSADDLYLSGELGEFSFAGRATSRDAQEFYTIGYADNPSNYFDSRSDFLNLGWKREFTNTLSLEGHVSKSHKGFYVRSDISTGAGTIIEGQIEEQELATQWILQGGDETKWLIGWEWRNPELINTDAHIGTLANPYSIVPLAPQAPEDGRYINGEFVQLQLPLTQTLALTTGLRHDDYSDFGEHSSPRIALVQQIGEHDTIKALYSEAFRAPSRVDTSSNSLVILKNPDLKPETAKTSELIWLHIVDTGLLSTTLFNSQIKDAITTIAVAPTQRQPVNSELTVAGLEISWQKQWSDNWRTRIAATDIFDPVGEIHTQSNTLFGGSLSYENRGWTATLLANYQSSMVDPNEQNSPADFTTTETTRFGGRTVYGAHLAYQAIPELECYFNIDNLFNKQYRSPAFSPNNYEGVPGTGRIVMLGIRWSFD